MNNSYIYIYHVNVTQTVPDISPLMPMHQDPLLVYQLWANSPFHEIFTSWWCLEFQPITGTLALQCGTVCCYAQSSHGGLDRKYTENVLVEYWCPYLRKRCPYFSKDSIECFSWIMFEPGCVISSSIELKCCSVVTIWLLELVYIKEEIST